MEACAAQARLDGGVRLPAVGRVPRVLVLMREIVALGDTALSGERLLMALRAFDDVQALTMAEIWAVPTALRRALSEAFCQGACAILERARERRAAERFVEARGGMGRAGDSPAFFERAPATCRGAGTARSARPARGSDGPHGRERRKDDPPGA